MYHHQKESKHVAHMYVLLFRSLQNETLHSRLVFALYTTV
jgi:hypothetical protein